ncbi:hypothetical protein AHAS_Ahas16G0184400 [Arachis hypogaea]
MATNRFVSRGTRTCSCTGEGTTCRGSFGRGRRRRWCGTRLNEGIWGNCVSELWTREVDAGKCVFGD